MAWYSKWLSIVSLCVRVCVRVPLFCLAFNQLSVIACIIVGGNNRQWPSLAVIVIEGGGGGSHCAVTIITQLQVRPRSTEWDWSKSNVKSFTQTVTISKCHMFSLKRRLQIMWICCFVTTSLFSHNKSLSHNSPVRRLFCYCKSSLPPGIWAIYHYG